jgi:phenylacetic acid degradation operon negative regulatory protein
LRYAIRVAHPLARILDQFRREPSRTGSLVITFFGDAIVPRGGSVWLGTLLDFFAALEIDSGVVRTAMSRLAADGWLARSRIGRNSYYRLADKGRQRFDAAMRHVYETHSTAWSGRLDLVLVLESRHREAARAELRAELKDAGFGSPLPNLWIAPPGQDATTPAGAIRLSAETDVVDGLRLVREAWPLDRIAGGYQRLLQAIEPLHGAIGQLSDAEGFVARILLVHGYRRVVLHDPLIPAALLPKDWPGDAARALCKALYQELVPASERWLDAHGSNEEGALPAAKALERRFADFMLQK